jgi:hypothetical protein
VWSVTKALFDSQGTLPSTTPTDVMTLARTFEDLAKFRRG